MKDITRSSTRRYDFDWLRVLLILTVFIFHSLRFFNLEGWNVKNPQTYMSIQILVVFVSRWMMPLIMIVSGAATFYMLGKRGAGEFLKDRALRLLIPLLVGIFTHVAWQGYLSDIGQNHFVGSFWQWYPTPFQGLANLGGRLNWTGAHLWYLEALFIISLVCLPLLLWLRRGAGQAVLAWFDDRLSAPGAVYLLGLPVLVLVLALNPSSGSILADVNSFGGWSIPNYLVFFLIGFLLGSSASMQASIRRMRRASLAAGIGAFAIIGILFFTFGEQPFGTPLYYLAMTILTITAWGCILGILGFGMEYLNRPSPWLAYANEAVLPFYVLHQSVMLTVGFFVVNWALPDLLKWALIVSISFAAILATYELMVRRLNLLRFLFGMKPAPSEAALRKPVAEVS